MPFRFQQITIKRRVNTSIFTWIAAILFVCTALYLRENADRFVDLPYLLFGWLIPLHISCIVYAVCMVVVRKRPINAGGDAAIIRRTQENKKVVNMILIIIALYYLCTAPLSFRSIAEVFLEKDSKLDKNKCVISDLLKEMMTVMFYLNACLNPFIYAKVHPEFSRIVRNAFNKCSCEIRNTRTVTSEAHGGVAIAESAV